MPLKAKFHKLYALELDKQVLVTQKLIRSDRSSSFRCMPRGGVKSV